MVELNISVWPASKIDREITDQVNTNAGAVSSASQTKKNLFAGTSMRKDIEKFAARVRLYHNQHTLPWADKGERLLPTKLFMDYKTAMNHYEQQFNQMCNNFFIDYNYLVQEAQVNLGTMYKAEDYPDLTEVRTKFGFRRAINPLPESGDFRLDVSTQDLDELRAEFESKFQERLADAVREPWLRLHGELVSISKKLTDTDGEGKKRYHDTLLSNPLELCELLTKLNVTNDPKLEEARKQVELTMLGVNMDAIKEDSETRKQVKSKVDEILGKFNW